MLKTLINLLDFKGRRRKRIAAQPFPDEWQRILQRNVPFYATLSPDDQAQLRRHILVFLDEKYFEGVSGLEMTDEIRVTIAAQACLLLLNRPTDYYPSLSSIIVYPSAYVAHDVDYQDDGTVVEGPQTRLGESWEGGNVVLAWDNVEHGVADPDDGHNVVLHEFAHQLDSETGTTEGAPVLPDRTMYTAWAKVLSREYEELVEDVQRRRRTFLDPYGAENPAEFFAVITEFFFERPRQLRARHPELYEQLTLFYRQDPAERPNAD